MKTKHLFLAALFLLGGFFVHSQTIVEKTYPVATNATNGTAAAKKHPKLAFDKKNYDERVLRDGVKAYTKKPITNQKKPITNLKASKDEDQVTLTVVLVFDPDMQGINYVGVLGENGTDNQMLWYEGFDTLQTSTNTGVYDIVLHGLLLSAGFPHNFYVIKELVVVDKDTTIIINATDAKNRVINKLYNDKGVLFELPVMQANGEREGGNVKEIIFINNVITSTCLWRVNDALFAFAKNNLAHNPLDYFISDLSDRFTIGQYALITDMENNKYVVRQAYNSVIQDSIILENHPQDYVAYTQTFQITPLGETTQSHAPVVSVDDAMNGVMGALSATTASVGNYNDNESSTLYLDNKVSNASNPEEGYNLLVKFGIVDNVQQQIMPRVP